MLYKLIQHSDLLNNLDEISYTINKYHKQIEHFLNPNSLYFKNYL